MINSYGRMTIYANYTEDELTQMPLERLKIAIIDIIKNSADIHEENANDTKYLIEYYKGKQDILQKKKKTRTDINNKITENWAYALLDFKKGWLLGKPIQYSLQGNKSSEEITELNRYCGYRQKKALDEFIYEDILITGRGFRYIDSSEDKEIDVPFDIVNIDPECCEVVYSSGIKHEQLLSYIVTSKKYIVTDDTGKEVERYYNEYTVYTRLWTIVVKDTSGYEIVGNPIPNILKEHRITEYYINRQRISLIELGKDLFDNINRIESLDTDDMEQFVNAIMVFINADVSNEEIEKIKELGAVKITSTANMQSDIKLLEQRLNSESTNSIYSRNVNALHQILGIPKAGDSGDITYGDTGQARLTGQGYTSAGIRAYNDETTFGMCDLKSLRLILKICREKQSEIKSLKPTDIVANFQRDMSDNLLVKAQALQILYEAKVPREIVNTLVGLFPDPNIVTKIQKDHFGEEGEEKKDQPMEKNNNNKPTQNIQNRIEQMQDVNEKTKQSRI